MSISLGMRLGAH